MGQTRSGAGGIAAAQAAGLKVKINTVALRGINEDEIDTIMHWAHERAMDLTLIETMPMGEIDGDRTDQYLPLSLVRARLAERYRLEESDHRTGGPARYVRVAETGGTLGFITPLTHNFCESCNRVRLTCTGRSTCVSAKTTPPICGRLCAPAPTTRCCRRRSTRQSCASPRATTSSSIGGMRNRRWRAICR